MTAHPAAFSLDRIPPHNLEAEMAVLGSILVDKAMMEVADEIIRPGDFYAHVHQTIYDTLLAIFRDNPAAPLDKIVLADELRNRGALERVGGLPYINALMDTVQTAASARYYATIVHEKAVLRSLIHAGTEITQFGYEGEEDVASALDRSQQLVFGIGQRGVSQFTQVKDLMKDAFDRIDRLFHHKGDRTGLTAGFHDIDQMTTGFQPGNFVIIAARPGMGKTSFALNMSVAAAKEEGAPVAFFSLEMSNDELIQRLICSEARISMNNLRRGNVKPHQWEAISLAMGALNDLPIYLDDTGGLTVSDVRSRARRLKSMAGNLSAIFIDYLQLLRPATATRNANRNEEISEICRTLKVTAKDIGVPIIALAQLNRGVETRSDKRPMLADLRDCLTGDSLVANADTGERVPLSQIVDAKLRFNVWALDERLKLVRRPIVDAWEVGERPAFRVTTQSGRTIKCTDGHRFLTISGWKELKHLEPGTTVAVPDTQDETHHDASTNLPSRGGTMVLERPRSQLSSRACRGTARSSGLEAPLDTLGVTQAQSDVVWEPIVAIEPLGVERVYDLTVGDLHNFCVDDIVTHNSGSLEQEADLVAFLYREGYYNKEAPEPDLTEFIISKHRNGPTGMVKLRFADEFTLFQPYGDESRYPAP